MRTIKFRGKRVDDDEWVYGSLLWMNGVPYIYPDPAPEAWNDYAVIPDTVGQFTGLLDKNHTEIYEGDVLSEAEGHVAIVEWDDEDAHFEASWVGCIASDSLWVAVAEGRVVLGNIHDNPELLKQNE